MKAEVDQEKLAAWLEFEAACLWTSLQNAIAHAHRGAFSIECESVAGRLVSLIRITGPIPWEKVPWGLVGGGVWLRLHQIAGVAPVVPTPYEAAYYEARLGGAAGSRGGYARTLDQLQDKGVLARIGDYLT